jgi:hypothetical protein
VQLQAYTSQLVALTMLSLLLARDSIEKRALRDEIADELLNLPVRVRAALELDGRVRELAASLKDEKSLIVLGRGHDYATALEAALKARAARCCCACIDLVGRAAEASHVVSQVSRAPSTFSGLACARCAALCGKLGCTQLSGIADITCLISYDKQSAVCRSRRSR